MTRTLTLLIAAAATCLCSLSLAAEESDSNRSPKQRHAALFKNLDSNHDGSISADEVPDEDRRLFERLKRRGDKDDDGQLTQQEFIAALEEDLPEGERRLGNRRDGRRGEKEPRDDETGKDRPSRTERRSDDQPGEPERPNRRRPDRNRPEARRDADRPDGDRPEGRRDAGDRPERQGPDGPRRGRPEGRPEGGPDRPRGPNMGPALMRALDTDGDGKISSSEISDAATALKKLDKNGDGEISRDELLPPQAVEGFRPRGDAPARPDGGFGRGPNMEVLMNRLKSLDKDGDGKFTKEELPERMRENFDRIDINDDGTVDEAELRQMVSGPGRFRRPDGDRPEGRRRGDNRGPEGRGPRDRDSAEKKPDQD